MTHKNIKMSFVFFLSICFFLENSYNKETERIGDVEDDYMRR